MPKFPTFPTLYNDALQIHLSKLKEWGYLDPGQVKSGAISWNRNGSQTSSISIQVNTLDKQRPFVELNYQYRDETRNYKVQLVSTPSNLSNGQIWYFLCPQTGKRCRKLYAIGSYFLHREAFKGGMYKSQIQSKSYRQLDKTLGAYFRTDQLYKQLYKKHFKKTYARKPTKKYLRIIAQIRKAYHTTKLNVL